MSLYHEAAEFLTASPREGGSLKARIFKNSSLKSPPSQLYALVLETSKWSPVLKEVIERAEVLKHERKLTPAVVLLLVHDFLVAKGGIALPQSHGLRQSIERHKGRLQSELTLARLRRKVPTMDALREQVERDSAGEEANYPRWVRVNAVKSSIEEQLETTFARFTRAPSLQAVLDSRGKPVVFLDPHVPNLLAVAQGAVDLTKTAAYASGQIILQDKASCFPAYLLDPGPGDGDVVDACAAPGNKTTHLAAIVHAHRPTFEEAAGQQQQQQSIFAFEKDARRARTLEKMVQVAGSRKQTKIGPGQDFLQVDPLDGRFKNVGALLLDPSCSGSGIVGRDSMPEVHLPEAAGGGGGGGGKKTSGKGKDGPKEHARKKRKHDEIEEPPKVLVDDDGNELVIKSEKDLEARLQALSSFQLLLLLHAFKFPAATKITYSTCSIHAEENEHVVCQALASDVARARGWRIMRRDEQVTGMREWPVRGLAEACGAGGDKGAETEEVAEGCIRSYKGDGRGVMGFFVAGFVREAGGELRDGEEGPYVRDEEGGIVRDVVGMPVLKSTGLPVELIPRDEDEVHEEKEAEESDEDDSSDEEEDDDDDDDGEEWTGFGD